MINEAIEPFRRDKTIGSSLEADFTAYDVEPEAVRHLFETMDLAELCIVSKVTLGPPRLSGNHITGWGGSLEPVVTRTANHKCGRCWRYLPEVTSDGELCARCDGVVNG
jgi:isoleucyl-tRNA synthetase